MKNKILFIGLFQLILAVNVYGQDSLFRHQVSIDASNFLSFLFTSDQQGIQLHYRHHPTAKSTLRSAIGYAQTIDDDSDEKLEFIGQLGYSRGIKTIGKWQFYFGLDGLYGRSFHGKKGTTRIGALPFLGISYHLSPQFSISTEPNFHVIRHHSEDPENFDLDLQNTYWTDFGLGNIGQILVNFRF